MHTPPTWIFGRQEPELRSLYEWIDSGAYQGRAQQLWGIWGGVSGTAFGLGGAAIGILVGGAEINPTQNPGVIIFPLLTAALISAGTALALWRRQTPGQRAASRAMADARTFTWQLMTARWHGNIRGFIGDDRAIALNDAAAAYMRARTAVAASPWKAVAPDTDYAATRDRTMVAIEVAMARVVTMIGQGSGGNAPEVQRIIRDMHEAADEAVRTSEKLATDSGKPGDASENLRQVVSEMRLLNDAQDEYERLKNT